MECQTPAIDTLILVQNFYSGMMSSDFARNGLNFLLDLDQEKSAAVLVFTDELHELCTTKIDF